MHPDEVAFLEAIHAGDETARLVFADWLDDRGDPRGPWIRDPEIWPFMAPDATDPVRRLLRAANSDQLLARLGPAAMPTLARLLRDEDATEHYCAMQGIKKLLPRPMQRNLYSPEAGAEMQRLVGPHAAEMVQALAAMLGNKTACRNEVVAWLVALSRGAAGAAVAPALATALRDDDENFRVVVAHTLSDVPLTADLVPALTGALRDENGRVRQCAATALGRLGAKAVESVPALTAALRDESADVRLFAAYALQGIGAAALEAVGPLVEVALDDEPESVSRAAQSALRAIDPDSALTVAALNDVLRSPKKRLRAAAAEALDTIATQSTRETGLCAAEAVPALVTSIPALARALRDDHLNVRVTAGTALARLGTSAVNAVPALVTALGDRFEEMRQVAAWALSQIGIAAVPALVATLGDERAEARDAAALALEWLREQERDAEKRRASDAADEIRGARGWHYGLPPCLVPPNDDEGASPANRPAGDGDDAQPGDRPDRDAKGAGGPGRSRRTWWGGFQVSQLQKRRRISG